MDKDKIIYDMEFRIKKNEYGLNSQDFEIYDEVIIINTPKKGIYVLLDKNYNTIGIHKVEFANMHLSKKEIAEGYNELYNLVDKDSGCIFLYPFDNLSLKQILELANRISIHDTNNGHSSYAIVNGDIVTNEEDTDYVNLLSYIKFLSGQIEEYFFNAYQMKIIGFDYPDVYSYIRNIMDNIDKCIDINIKNNKRPFPRDVMEYLGKNRKTIYEDENELYGIIDLLLKQKGYKIKGGFNHYNEIEPIAEEKEDLSTLSSNLLKLLELSNEELSEKQKKINETMHVEEINLKEYLEQDISKDKKLSLK